MANTQTTVPKFTTLEVLSSEDQNLTAGTGCPVFATTVTRDAAFGGAGEKVLAEGQICYLESTNVVQLYDGAAWQTVGPTPAVSSGLTYVGGGALSGAATTFSNVFSATYDNYLIVISNAIGTGSPTIKGTIGAITTGYIAGSGLNGGAFGYSASQAFWDFGYCGDGSDYVVTQMTLVNPFLTQKKIAYGNNIYSTNLYYQLTGTNSSTTSCTSLTLTASANTFTAGNARIYGYSNS